MPMSFTAADLNDLEDAIRALITGSAISVKINGREYVKPKLEDYMKAYTQMKSLVNLSTSSGIMRGTFVNTTDLIMILKGYM